MKLTLRELTLTNFKGIKDYTVGFDGHVTNIRGANGTGKTTIADAFMWLLFGKDSKGDKEFPVKPKDVDGNEIHNLTTKVYGLFDYDGNMLELERELNEKWTKVRGQANATYGGNTESFRINGGSVKLADYKAFIGSIVDEDVFTLVTNPMAFNSLEWKKRREMLLKLCNVDVDSMLREDAEYGGIASEIAESGLGIERFRKAVMDKRTAANKQIATIPARIDEIARMKTEVRATLAEAKKLAAEARDDVNAAQETLATVRVMSDATGKRETLAKAIQALDEYKTEVERQNRVKYDAKMAMIAAEQEREKTRLREEEYAKKQIERYTQNIAEYEAKAQALREQWKAVKAEVFAGLSEGEQTCPTCGQTLPQEEIERLRVNAEESFNARKESRLKEISARGKEYNAYIENARQSIVSVRESMEKLSSVANGVDERKRSEIDRMTPYEPFDFSDDKECIRLETVVKTAQNALQGISGGTEVKQAEEALYAAEMRKQEADNIMAALVRNDECDKRIEDLERTQRELGDSIADAETKLLMVEAYTRKRVSMLTEAVDALCPTVRWKLVKENINGGIEDICVCLVENKDTGARVPWEKANSAGRINAGLEIINVLSDYYDVSVPVFIDNAESVNRVAATIGQQILLTVTEDEELDVISE